ncbi:MAG: MFS transporter [Rhodospirillales bacterium 20-64-7]|nr:MAG: MFS transporter [Rhodospirillales bacterium 20-64-7]
MDSGVITQQADRHAGLGFRQFVALVAALMATNALAIDSMLPALGKISVSLGITADNERQWVVTSYLLGFGAAQIIYGTLADRYGRKPVIQAALAIYVAASLGVAFTHSFDTMMLLRVLQGLGAAGTRVLAVSVVRDCYEGRRMARVMSLSFLVFLGVPVLAPSIGQLIMLAFPWRGIFVALGLYGALILLWISRRLPETLNPADRRPIEFAGILAAARITLTNRVSVGYTLAMSLVLGGLFGFINSAQQVFTSVFHDARFFPLIFAVIAGAIAVASLLNARLVGRVGSRAISHAALFGFIAIAAIHAGVALSGHETIWSFAILQSAMMFCFGLMVGNFGAMAMEPLGHIAGSAASIQGCFSTLASALVGFFIGQNFNGTVVPLTLGFAVCSLAALGVVFVAERGRLFQPQHPRTS